MNAKLSTLFGLILLVGFASCQKRSENAVNDRPKHQDAKKPAVKNSEDIQPLAGHSELPSVSNTGNTIIHNFDQHCFTADTFLTEQKTKIRQFLANAQLVRSKLAKSPTISGALVLHRLWRDSEGMQYWERVHYKVSDKINALHFELVAAQHIIVLLRHPEDISHLNRWCDEQHLESPIKILEDQLLYRIKISGSSPTEAQRYLDDLDKNVPGVYDASEDPVVLPASDTLLPNDPITSWHHAKVGCPEVWAQTQGSPSVIAAVIDNSFDITHPDLSENIWVNPDEIPDGKDNDNNGLVDDIRGWNFLGNNGSLLDPTNNHGTAVAGIIGATGNNTIGVTGMNWKIKIMPLRTILVSHLVSATEYAMKKKADFINYSVISPGIFAIYDNALLRLMDRAKQGYPAWNLPPDRILFICAAANLGYNLDEFHWNQRPNPASLPRENVISVANTESSDFLRSTSNYGKTTVHLAAPGTGLSSLNNGGGYLSFSGTSASTPVVTGAAALLRSRYPQATATQIRDALLDGVDHPVSLRDKVFSQGRLNVAKAMGILSLHSQHPKINYSSAPINLTIPQPGNATILETPIQVHNTGNGHLTYRFRGLDNYYRRGPSSLSGWLDFSQLSEVKEAIRDIHGKYASLSKQTDYSDNNVLAKIFGRRSYSIMVSGSGFFAGDTFQHNNLYESPTAMPIPPYSLTDLRPDELIAVYWDNFETAQSAGGKISWKKNNDRLAFRWDNFPLRNSSADEKFSAQVEVLNNGQINIRYEKVPFLPMGTVGYCLNNAIAVVNYSFQQVNFLAHNPTLSLLPGDWLQIDESLTTDRLPRLSLEPGQTRTHVLTVLPAYLPPGRHERLLRLESNDPHSSVIERRIVVQVGLAEESPSAPAYYQDFVHRYFSPQQIAGGWANPHVVVPGSTIPNLLAYAFNRNPWTSSFDEPILNTSLHDDLFVVETKYLATLNDAEVGFEESRDLVTWNPANPDSSEFSTQTPWVRARLTFRPVQPNFFVKIRVSLRR